MSTSTEKAKKELRAMYEFLKDLQRVGKDQDPDFDEIKDDLHRMYRTLQQQTYEAIRPPSAVRDSSASRPPSASRPKKRRKIAQSGKARISNEKTKTMKASLDRLANQTHRPSAIKWTLQAPASDSRGTPAEPFVVASSSGECLPTPARTPRRRSPRRATAVAAARIKALAEEEAASESEAEEDVAPPAEPFVVASSSEECLPTPERAPRRRSPRRATAVAAARIQALAQESVSDSDVEEVEPPTRKRKRAHVSEAPSRQLDRPGASYKGTALDRCLNRGNQPETPPSYDSNHVWPKDSWGAIVERDRPSEIRHADPDVLALHAELREEQLVYPLNERTFQDACYHGRNQSTLPGGVFVSDPDGEYRIIRPMGELDTAANETFTRRKIRGGTGTWPVSKHDVPAAVHALPKITDRQLAEALQLLPYAPPNLVTFGDRNRMTTDTKPGPDGSTLVVHRLLLNPARSQEMLRTIVHWYRRHYGFKHVNVPNVVAAMRLFLRRPVVASTEDIESRDWYMAEFLLRPSRLAHDPLYYTTPPTFGTDGDHAYEQPSDASESEDDSVSLCSEDESEDSD